ncbi:MAG: hypothetical protein CMJ29_05675 [Phycisphaerae bacterium]|nr:hypothetical protein [Phycisphaerae bacterium]|tara:strand:- start:2389 stop:3762 length:1374 start_codon:yes stop_codon:yes gene_type:complete
MAIRSTAGTGVVVALVVFIIISAALLATTIIFYSQRGKAVEEKNTAEAQLDKLATATERSSDAYQAIENQSGRNSVYGHLKGQHDDLMAYVGRDMDIDALKEALNKSIGVDSNGTLWTHMQTTHQQLQSDSDSISRLKDSVQQLQEEKEEIAGRLSQAERERDESLQASVDRQLDGIRKADTTYEEQIAQAIDDLEQAKERYRNRYVGQIRDLENEVDELSEANVQGESRIEELQRLISRNRIQPEDPANLADGEVIEVTGRGDQVYIDRGKNDQIVLGMTFEVYDDAAQLRPDAEGNFPRGKASIQIVKVGESTATGKVTRSTRGRPVVRGDIVANAIYDPNYTFKFLVHGRFDVDNDGHATLEETDFVRRQIESWGGKVIKEDRITGDLDFLVLGVEPPKPANPDANATEQQIQQILDLGRKHDKYQELFRSASRADIPVLNANRLYILTGQNGL